jgi:hypothetical protein
LEASFSWILNVLYRGFKRHIGTAYMTISGEKIYIKNLGLDPDPDLATAWTRIQQKMPGSGFGESGSEKTNTIMRRY